MSRTLTSMVTVKNYTILDEDADIVLIDCAAPAGVYTARLLENGLMEIISRVRYVEELHAELESLRTIPMPVVEKTKTRSKTDKSAANRELAAALRACNKGSVNGVWPEWSRAQQFIKNGLSVEEAAGKA